MPLIQEYQRFSGFTGSIAGSDLCVCGVYLHASGVFSKTLVSFPVQKTLIVSLLASLNSPVCEIISCDGFIKCPAPCVLSLLG